MFSFSLLNQFICKAVTETPTEEIADAYLKLNDSVLWKEANANQVESIVAHALMTSLSLDKVPDRWHSAHKKVENRISAYLSEVDRLGTALAENGIIIVALKNAGIARGISACRGCCPMGDIDVLVKKEQFSKAHEILLYEGYQFEFRNPLEKAVFKATKQCGGAEYWKLLPNGEKMWFELQWRPVAGRWLRPDQEPAAEELIDRSISINGTSIRLLSPEDNLLQITLHTAKHTYIRAPGFRLHLDVDRIVRKQKVDWDIFVERVLRLQVKTPVYFSLLLPKYFFKSPIPNYVLDRLKPSKWKIQLILTWLQRAGFFSPEDKKFGRVGYVLFNSLLYDDLRGLYRGGVPDSAWMMDMYGFNNSLLLPFYYLKRITDLTFKRLKT